MAFRRARPVFENKQYSDHPCPYSKKLFGVALKQAVAKSALLIVVGFSAAAHDVVGQRLREPLPVTVAASYRDLARRAPIDLSSDGELLAYTVESDDLLSQGSYYYSASGVPKSEGGTSPTVCITNTRTGENITLEREKKSSWGGVWSPDGRQLAFYADWNGKAGIWIWDRHDRQLRQIPELVARPFFFFETIRWSSDSRQILCKIVPEAMTLEQANNLTTQTKTSRFPSVNEGAASVFVLGTLDKARLEKENTKADAEVNESESSNRFLSDLALIDVQGGQINRLLKRIKPIWYSFSPDQKQIAFTNLKGWEFNSQQTVVALEVLNLASGERKTLAPKLRTAFGINVSWSPDSKHLSYTTFGQRAAGECFIVAVDTGETAKVSGKNLPNFGDYESRPLWDFTGKSLYLVGAGNLWKIDPATNAATEFAKIPNHRIVDIAAIRGDAEFWSPDHHQSIVVNTSDAQTMMTGFFKIDLKTGRQTRLLEENRTLGIGFSFDASEAGRLAFYSEDAQQPRDIWIADFNLQNLKRASSTNPALDRYEMGKSRLIEWRSVEGETLRGSLLLPVGFEEGKQYPLIVFVYGGAYGSREVNRYAGAGLASSSAFNVQILATRGYAVLFPDAPVRIGTPLRDLYNTVMPGVNKAIDMGIADPDRLGIMGQSYGSFSTLALIVQTSRFKAAVITAVVNPDYLGAYLHMQRDGGASTGYYEEGQGGLGGTPWEYRNRYLENSPIFYFDRIQTPVLIGQGTDDLPLTGADSTFVALRRLGKEVEYRQYENEGHVIQRRANIIDFWNRRIEWFEKYLKAPANPGNSRPVSRVR